MGNAESHPTHSQAPVRPVVLGSLNPIPMRGWIYVKECYMCQAEMMKHEESQ